MRAAGCRRTWDRENLESSAGAGHDARAAPHPAFTRTTSRVRPDGGRVMRLIHVCPRVRLIVPSMHPRSGSSWVISQNGGNLSCECGVSAPRIGRGRVRWWCPEYGQLGEAHLRVDLVDERQEGGQRIWVTSTCTPQLTRACVRRRADPRVQGQKRIPGDGEHMEWPRDHPSPGLLRHSGNTRTVRLPPSRNRSRRALHSQLPRFRSGRRDQAARQFYQRTGMR